MRIVVLHRVLKQQGTTSTVMGLQRYLTEGWLTDEFEIEARDSFICRVQIWGLR